MIAILAEYFLAGESSAARKLHDRRGNLNRNCRIPLVCYFACTQSVSTQARYPRLSTWPMVQEKIGQFPVLIGFHGTFS